LAYKFKSVLDNFAGGRTIVEGSTYTRVSHFRWIFTSKVGGWLVHGSTDTQV